MSSNLLISHYVHETKVLGPYLRSAMWVSGCCFECEGCIAKDMNRQKPSTVQVEDLIREFSEIKSCEGITISGGEPFLQAKALSDLLEGVKKKRDYGVIIYTGYTLEDLHAKNDKEIERLLANTDILIDGRYILELDDGKPYRGSSNQRILMLTDRYKEVFEEYYHGHDKRDLEIRIERDRTYMIGVPSRHGIETWKDLKKRTEGNVEGV